MRISRSSAHTKVGSSHSRKTSSLGDLRLLRATILDHPRKGVACILPLFSAPDQTHSRSHTSEAMRADTPVSSTTSLMRIQRSSSSALPRITAGPYSKHGIPAVQRWQVSLAASEPGLRAREDEGSYLTTIESWPILRRLELPADES
jgi:hypothetical protein